MKKKLIQILFAFLFSALAMPAMSEERTYPIDADAVKISKTSNVSMWQGFEFGRPTNVAQFFDDFFDITLARWVVTETGTNTQAIKDAANGILLLTNAAADNDVTSMQLGNTGDATTGESFLPAVGRTIWCESKFAISDATDSDFLVGLSITDTTPIDSANAIIFRKDDDATALKFQTGPTATASLDSNVGTMTAATYTTVGFRVTGTSLVEYWVDGVKKGSFTTNIPTTEMRPTIMIQNGTNAAKNASIDYLFCAETR